MNKATSTAKLETDGSQASDEPTLGCLKSRREPDWRTCLAASLFPLFVHQGDPTAAYQLQEGRTEQMPSTHTGCALI